MKKILYIMCAVLVVAFASCSKSEMGDETSQSKETVLKVIANEGLETRATSGVDRFAIEVYTDEAYTTPAAIFGYGDAATNKASNTTGEFTLILDRTQKYYCLFWADKAGAKSYEIGNLKSVTLASGETPAEAWFGKAAISGNSAIQTITLNRAVAKLNLLETGPILANTTLTAKFDQPTVFNVAEQTASTNISRTETITLVDAVNGTKENPVKLNSTDIFIIAPVATQYVATLTFKCGEEDAFEVLNVPFQANYATNIKGHYTTLSSETFTVSCDDTWNTPDNEGSIIPAHIFNDDTKAVLPEGKGTETEPYLLSSAANIKWLNELCDIEGGTNNKYFKLMNDIEVTTTEWKPIGNFLDFSPKFFNGCFDGNGHQFTGKIIANQKTSIMNFGIFGIIGKTGIVKNLTNAATIIAPKTDGVGGIAGGCDGIIINCKNTATITAKQYVGGIIGCCSYRDMTPGENIVISGCENSGDVIGLNSLIGGITGMIIFDPNNVQIPGDDAASIVIENCKNTGNISSPAEARAKIIGGILGDYSIQNGTCKLKNCTNSGIVYSGDIIATENFGNSSGIGLLVGGQQNPNMGTIVIE